MARCIYQRLTDSLPQDLRERAGIPHAKANGKAPAEVGRLLSTVKPERVAWLWPGRIPRGKLTIIEGDPDLGKSALTTDLAARVSVGRPWPDGSPCKPGGVVLLNAEDGLADTVRPRLDAVGGDAERVLALATVPDGNSERMLSIPEDLDIIRRGIGRVKASLLVIDPFMAFLGGDVNSHRDQDVRRALAPLGALGEETGAAIVVVRHLNKANGGNPLYRGGGSVGIVGAARSALLVAEHPEDDDLRVLARVKGNLAKPVPSIAFALTEVANGAVRVEWKGETNHTAAALLAAPTDPEERSAQAEAMEFLREALGSGPVGSSQVKKDARAAGITEITLKRAKAALRVRSRKQGDGPWTWEMPEVDHEPYTSQDDPLDPLPMGKPVSGRRGEEQGDHHDLLDRSGDSRTNKPDPQGEGAQGDQGAHGSGSSARRLSAEEVQKVRKLIQEGMAPEWARREVLGDWEV